MQREGEENGRTGVVGARAVPSREDVLEPGGARKERSNISFRPSLDPTQRKPNSHELEEVVPSITTEVRSLILLRIVVAVVVVLLPTIGTVAASSSSVRVECRREPSCSKSSSSSHRLPRRRVVVQLNRIERRAHLLELDGRSGLLADVAIRVVDERQSLVGNPSFLFGCSWKGGPRIKRLARRVLGRLGRRALVEISRMLQASLYSNFMAEGEVKRDRVEAKEGEPRSWEREDAKGSSL